MLSDKFILLLESILKQALQFDTKPDKLLLDRFAKNRLSKYERSLIVDVIYTVIRNYHKLVKCTNNNHLKIIGLCLVQLLQLDPSSYQDITLIDFDKLKNIQFHDDIESHTELPQWLIDILKTQMSEKEIIQFATAINQRATLDLRVNTLKTNLKNVEKILNQENIPYQRCTFSPYGIRLALNAINSKHRLINEGLVVIQDESSQIATSLLSPKQHSVIVDFCAGSGGKTLSLGMLTKNTGRIYAFDTNETRLNKLPTRVKQSNLSQVYPQLIANENDAKLERLKNKVDYALVDAPCSGLGTLRRSPELKFRQSINSIQQFAKKQLEILAAASTLVKPGGNLVYATCSILKIENQDIVIQFLNENSNFELVPAYSILNKKLSHPLSDGEYQYAELMPHIHQTDGFFAALLKRKI